MMGTGRRSARTIPRRYSARRNATAAPNTIEAGRSATARAEGCGEYQAATRRSESVTAVAAGAREAQPTPSLRSRRLGRKRDVDESGETGRFHHMNHRLMGRVGIRVDDHDRLLRAPRGLLQ